jgi:predicted DNA binding protein
MRSEADMFARTLIAVGHQGMPMPRVRMKVEPYGSLAEFSATHPDVELRLQAGWRAEEGFLSITETDASDANVIRSYFDDAPEVHSYEVVHADDEILVIQAQTTIPDTHQAAREAGTLPRFPLIVRGGWIHNDMAISHEQLSRFTAELEAAGVGYEIVSITRSVDVSELLTERQYEFVTEAIERGYYDSPRRCSVTDLANALGVNKATASGILHRAEGQLIKQSLLDRPNGQSLSTRAGEESGG